MTAPFAAKLCGYRPSGNPSTSDNNDRGSVEWGAELFRELGVGPETKEVPNIGAEVERLTVQDLATVRQDLEFAGSRHASAYAQFAHLKVFKDFNRAYKGPSPDAISELDVWLSKKGLDRELRALLRRLKREATRADADHLLIAELRASMPEESLLRMDVAVSHPLDNSAGRLLIALSSKWSLRTDRAQDCVSQGAKLAGLRRGHMPHYAVLTMEPRPAMLRLIAYGSGSVDCVYHLALPELLTAARTLAKRRRNDTWGPRVELERMVRQGRVRDYTDLVAEVQELPFKTASSPRWR